MNLVTHHSRFAVRAITPLALDHQSGSAVRGAISHALWSRFCTNKGAVSCEACLLVQMCPVAALVAPMREEDEKGSTQRPRPYVVRPPVGGAKQYAVDDTFSFGIGLFGSAAMLFPYVVMAVQLLEQDGLGRKLAENRGKRGRFRIEEIVAYNPLTSERQVLYCHDEPTVEVPGLPIVPEQVAAYAAALPEGSLTLHLKTPMRLVDGGSLVRRVALRPLVQRLMRRLDDLCIAYGEGPINLDFGSLLQVAEEGTVRADRTRWVDVVSYSSRSKRRTPIGGLVGRATFVGNLAPLRELLVWGSLVHVGRNVVKGDGWYVVEAVL
jgi:hypothetical protein